MKAESYLRNIKSKYQHGNDWFQVKPGTAAVAVAETTPMEVMQYAGGGRRYVCHGPCGPSGDV